MGKKLLLGTGILVGLYLVVANATGFGKAVAASGQAYAGAVKTLQGR